MKMLGRNKDKEEEKELKEKPKKKTEESDWQWDKKKLAIFGILLLILAIGIYEFRDDLFSKDSKILGETTRIEEVEKPDINTPKINFSKDLGATLEDVRTSVTDLSPEEVASSSPQIQKLLNDIGQLKNLPANKVREACMNLCSGI